MYFTPPLAPYGIRDKKVEKPPFDCQKQDFDCQKQDFDCQKQAF